MRAPAVAFAIALIACSGPREKADQTAKDPVKQEPEESGKTRMLEHFLELASIERALIRGDLAAVKTHADALAAPRSNDPADWAPHVADIKKAAKAVGAADTVAAATTLTTEVVKTCATCHEAFNVEFEPTWVPDPPPPTNVEQKMRRHQWGLDLMRLSLMFKHDELWLRATKVLTSAPLHPSEITSPGTIDVAVVKRANALRDLARAAGQVAPAERFATYGALLHTCVGCHADK